MTDKQNFIDRLIAALTERGVSDADMHPYIERFDRFYDRMANNPEDISPDVLNDIDTIANNIAAQIEERSIEITRLAERTMTINRVPAEDTETEPQTETVPETENGIGPTETADAETTDAEEYTVLSIENAPTEIIETGNLKQVDSSPTEERHAVDTDLYEDEDDIYSRLPDYVEEEPIPSSKMFWLIFGLTLPITIPLALLFLGVFAGIWVGLAALIIGSIAVLICGVAIGTALSLVGIIYGTVQLFSVAAIGLYEIGIGIIIAGTVMFVGILIYNFAIRFLPFVIRMVGKLFRFLLKKFKVLFNFLRRECAKL